MTMILPQFHHCDCELCKWLNFGFFFKFPCIVRIYAWFFMHCRNHNSDSHTNHVIIMHIAWCRQPKINHSGIKSGIIYDHHHKPTLQCHFCHDNDNEYVLCFLLPCNTYMCLSVIKCAHIQWRIINFLVNITNAQWGRMQRYKKWRSL